MLGIRHSVRRADLVSRRDDDPSAESRWRLVRGADGARRRLEAVARSHGMAGRRGSACVPRGTVRLDDAELVAFGVGEHDVTLVWALTDVDGAGAELDQPPYCFVLVIDRRGCEIEMDSVFAGLLLPGPAGSRS